VEALLSPTIFRDGPYRYFFFSREEPRMHVHVRSPQGEAKVWPNPHIELAHQSGLNGSEIARILKQVIANEEVLREAWQRYFGG
jgi:hypothetical protein